MGIVQEVSDAMERIPRSAWLISATLIAVGTAVRLGGKFGLFDPGMLDGHVVNGAGVAIAIGLGIVLIAVLLAIATIPGKIIGYVRDVKRANLELEALIENSRFLDPTSLLLLYSAIMMPNGRIPVFGSRSFERLWTQRLLVHDKPPGLVLFAGPPSSGMVRVAPRLFAARDEIIPSIRDRLAEKFSGDLEDQSHVETLLADAVHAERSALGFRI